MKHVYRCDHCSYVGTEEDVRNHESICCNNYLYVDIDGNPVHVGDKVWKWIDCIEAVVVEIDTKQKTGEPYFKLMTNDGEHEFAFGRDITICEPDVHDRINSLILMEATMYLANKESEWVYLSSALDACRKRLYGRFLDRVCKEGYLKY